jgi:hypothetical protein
VKAGQKREVFGVCRGFSLEFDIADREAQMKRSIREKIFEADRQIRENSPGWLRLRLDTLRSYQQKSLEPELWESSIGEIERKLISRQDQGLKDFLAYVLREKSKLSWQEMGDQLYRDIKGKVARRLRARRAYERAERKLELESFVNPTADTIATGQIIHLIDGRILLT